MPNLRVVSDNAADRATSVVASTTAGALTTANLKTEYKSEIWRSTSTTASLTIQWTNAELLGMLALVFCNLTSAATFRVRCYTNAADPTPVVDKTAFACGAADFDEFFWGGEALGQNGYMYDANAAYGCIYFTPGMYKKVVLDIADPVLTAGYVQASRLIVGMYWEPEEAAEAGATVGVIDNSKQERTDAGDLRTDRGTVHKSLNFDMNFLTTQDRNSLWNILRGAGLFKPLYISLLPESSADEIGEQVYQIYGKVTKQTSIKYALLNQSATQIEIEEM